MTENYTPGHSQNAVDFMSKRSLQSHGQFFARYLESGLSVLDCGCGPGTVTLDIAEAVAPGRVVGLDIASSQTERADANARERGITNVEFRQSGCYALPFPDETFDRVFGHALMEHLAEPQRALTEMRRVLVPGGIIGVCSPDWRGWLVAPMSPDLANAIQAYAAMQSRNGGDLEAGAKLGTYLVTAGFTDIQMTARYECYPSLEFIGNYLALQLERAGEDRSASTLRAWSRSEGGMFAQSWVSATGRKP
jgi:ubiquinone/menaquinone biosynthesis C-methylase UbiE